MVNVGLIGCGYWGKNYVNTIRNIPELKLKYIQDLKKPDFIPENTSFTMNIEDILDDPEIEGIFIVTPTSTHYKITRRVLEGGKHVLVEKPLTTNSKEAEVLCALAKRKGVVLMTGHIFKYNSAIRYVKERIEEGDLGNLRYIESRRVGLGPIRQDVSVLWDFITHDIYISRYLVGKPPSRVSCIGQSHNKKVDDIVSLNMRFQGDIFVSIYANWEHPIKERQIIIGGTKKAILFDDVQPTNKVYIYNTGVDYMPSSGDFGEFQASTRAGDILIPKLKLCPPLEMEIKHFIDCIKGRERCFSNGYEGLETIKILEAAEQSRSLGGLEVKIK